MISGRPLHGASPVAGELHEDVSTVRATYATVEAGDEEALSRYMGSRIEWAHPAVTRLPFDGIVLGLPSVLRAAFRRDENGAGPRISADTFVELGAGVLVAGRFFCGAGEEPFLHECSVRAGRIERIREYPV